jgi:hypothetical protein
MVAGALAIALRLLMGAGTTLAPIRFTGPSVELTACLDDGVYDVGDTIDEPFSTIALEAVVIGATGQRLHWIRTGRPVKSARIDEEGVLRTTLKAQPGDWFSVVISDENGPTLLTGAIYTE